MPDYASLLEQQAAAVIPTVPTTGAARLDGPELLALFGIVADGLRAFQRVTGGASFRLETRAPGPADGEDEDAWLNGTTGDVYKKVAGVWESRGNVKGPASTVPGPRGLPGAASTVPGPAGKSTYQLWLDAGNTGTLAAFLASEKGADGADGTDGANGNIIRDKSFAPGTSDATGYQEGDQWYHTKSASSYDRYAFINGVWRLQFSSGTATVAPPANQAPVVSISSPNAGITVTAGAQLNLVAVATDDVSVASVVFLNAAGGTLAVGAKNGSQYTATITVPATVGPFVITAKATDGAGLPSTAEVSVTVQAATLPTPAAPTWSFNSQTRVLSLAAPSGYESATLEYKQGSGSYQNYTAGLLIDGAAHAADEWQGRVKAVAGQWNVGNPKGSDAIVVNTSALATPGFTLARPVSITSMRATAGTVPNTASYRLFRATAQAGPYTQVGGALPTPDYTDTTLSPSITYWWKWQAISNNPAYTDSAESAPFSAATPAVRGVLEVRGGGATQSNFAGAAPREMMPQSYYIDNPKAYGLSIPRNAAEKWSLGSYNGGAPDQSTANDNGLYPYTLPPYGGHGPAPSFVKRWLENNAANAKGMLFYTLDVTTPDSVNSTTTRWLTFLLAQWKAEWTTMAALLKAQGWTGIRVILYHDLGEGNSMTAGELPKYYGDMVNLIGQMEAHILAFAGPGFSASVLGHGILWKQQNYTESGGTVRNIAGDINPLQAQLVANVAKAFKVEMPNTNPTTSFQNQYGNNTLIHYTSAEILRLGEYMATVENSLDIGIVFKEEFNDATSLANSWTSSGFVGQPGNVVVTGGKVNISPLANTAGVNVTGYRTNNNFSISGRRFAIDISQILLGTNTGMAVGIQSILGANDVQIYVLVEAGKVYLDDGVDRLAIVDYDGPTMRFLALRATDTDMLWQTSPDGIIWRTLASKTISQLVATQFNIASVSLSMFCYTNASVADPGTFVVESAKLEIV